jgi:pyocin large subunit-like protein
MPKNPGILLGAVLLLAALAFARFVSPVHHEASNAAPAVSSEAGWGAPIWTGGEANARHHWEKHGGEFPQFATEDAFVAGVHAFLLHPPAGTLTKHRSNGDTLYFHPASGTFAVRAADGAPRTFFKPDDGMAYWDRQ